MVANDTLLNLIDNEDWDGARKFLSSGPTDGSEDDFMVNILYQDDGSGETTLMLAVIREARTDIIASLIGKGGKELVMMKDNSGWTALHVACYKGPSVEVVKLLLGVGGEELLLIKDRDGRTALDLTNTCASDELDQIIKDFIVTFDFNKIIKSNKPNLPQLKSFVKEHGIKGLFTVLVDKGSLPIKSIAESDPSIDVIYYLIQKGVVKMGETEEEYRGKYPTIRSDWNDLLEKAVISKTSKRNHDRLGVLWSLAQKKYWKAIRIFMTINNIESETRKMNVFYQGGVKRDTVLHAAMKHKVPFDIVKLLADFGGRQLTLIQNKDKKTAYEIACNKGAAGPEIIEFLLPLSKEEILFLGKYRIPNKTAIHKSATSVVMKGECITTKKGVAVKFITNYEHYQKEHEHRERVKRQQTDENGWPLLVPIMDSFNSKKGVHQESPEAFKIKESILLMKGFDGEETEVKLSQYNYAIVMDLADRNLDAIYREEKPNKNMCRGSLEDVLTTMKTLHEVGLCHGDLKTRNCVRINGHIYIIDLDGASEIPTVNDDESMDMDRSNAAYYVGEKFSSGILAPEMIHRFQDKEDFDAFKSYFAELKGNDFDHWEKVKPMIHRECAYAVKTFLTTKRGTKRDIAGGESYTPLIVKDIGKLPYDLVLASEAIDLWSLGVLLYKF